MAPRGRHQAQSRTARYPLTQSSSKSLKDGLVRFPAGSSSWHISWLSLNAALSKRMLLPGEISSTNPKSMWMRFPRVSRRMLPLCLSLAWRKKLATAYLDATAVIEIQRSRGIKGPEA